MERTPRAQALVAPLSFVVAAITTYLATILVPYEMTDGYTMIDNGVRGDIGLFSVANLSQGRPIFDVLVYAATNVIQSIDGARLLHLCAAIGVGLVGWQMYRAACKVGWGRVPSVGLGLLVCTIPAFEIQVAWGVCAFFPWAALAAVTAAHLLDRTMASRAEQGRRAWFGSLGIAIAVLTAGMALYQPGGMVFVAAAAILLLGDQRATLSHLAKRYLVFGIALAVAVGIDGLLAKVLPFLVFDEAQHTARTVLASDLGAKFSWFLHEPLTDALCLWHLTPSTRLAWVVGCFCAVGLALYVRGGLLTRSIKLGMAVLLVPASYIPNLIVADSWAAYRTQAGLGCLVIVYVMMAVVFVGRALRSVESRTSQDLGKLLRAVHPVVVTALVVVGLLSAASNVLRFVVVPQREELDYLRHQVATADLSTASSIEVVPCAWQNTLSPVIRYDEFGYPSCATAWSPPSMLHLLLREEFPQYADLPITLATDSDAPAGTVLFDLRGVE